MLTVQTFLHQKLFGDYLAQTRPVEYRRADWQELCRGRERSVRLITRAMLGVPSAHQLDRKEEHAMWCFGLPKGSLLVVSLRKGIHVELSAKSEDEAEVQAAVDFLLTELTQRVKSLQEA
jgi:hypothetical protein